MEIYQPIFVLIATASVSFLGSLQLGPVNLSVLQATLTYGRRAGCWVALGGVLPEMLYAALAVGASMWLGAYPVIWQTLSWLTVLGLGVLAVVTFRTPARNVGRGSTDSASAQHPFLSGLTLGLLNPQLFPYWLVVLVQFEQHKHLIVKLLPEKIAFVAGTALGAFGLLLAVVQLSHYQRDWLLKRLQGHSLNQYLGVLFGLLALAQAYKLLFT